MSVSGSADFRNFGKGKFATVSLGDSLPHPCLFESTKHIILLVVEFFVTLA